VHWRIDAQDSIPDDEALVHLSWAFYNAHILERFGRSFFAGFLGEALPKYALEEVREWAP